MGKRKSYTPEFKAEIVLEAIKGEKIISQIASEFEIHPTLVSKWKKQFLENSYKVFSSEGSQGL